MQEGKITKEFIVTEADTAAKLGSGTLAVLATPMLVAFMENTAMQLVADLGEGESSVGTMINVQHLKASAVGENIRCTAEITNREGRKYNFGIEAVDSSGEVIGKATHERFVVNVERFMGKLNK
ncbi:hypothetical protein D0T49_02200 [Paludibacter sp. 221]|nr:thioesterase family protein [Paludibacter sp. 221]NDV45862.1 hypothetical protein [Paludibacter sp. 221]